MDNYYDIEEPPKKGFSVKKLLKWIAIALIAAVYAILIGRCALSRDVSLVKKVLADDEVKAAYSADPASFAVEQYGMNSAWVAVEEMRLIEFNMLYYLPAARQLQCSVKYNADIVDKFGDDGLPFVFWLTDEDGNRFDDYYFETAQKYRFRYIRLAFRGIDLLTGETDEETGLPERHTYMLHIAKYGEDGKTSEYTNYKLYDGSAVKKNIPYKG